MELIGRFLILAGLLLAAVGLILLLAPRIPMIGRLPGDLRFEWGDVQVYVPLATSLLLSLLLTLLLNLFLRR